MPDELLPTEYQTLTEGSTSGFDLSLIAPLLWASALVTVIITVLFFIYAIYVIVRRRKVENATLEMRDDIRRMRELMEQGSSHAAPKETEAAEPLAITPDDI